MTASAASSPTTKSSLNRREFLYAVGGASLALLGVGSCGVLSKFLNPVIYGETSGIYKLPVADIPQAGEIPKYIAEGYYYASHSAAGLLALDMYCSLRHEWQVKWVTTNNRFECPVCGSKYSIDGIYIEGPAPRGLDRFTVEVTTPNGTFTTAPDGSPVPIEARPNLSSIPTASSPLNGHCRGVQLNAPMHADRI